MISLQRINVFGPTSLCLLAALVEPGCGGRDVELVEVSGRVTVDGGQVPGPGTLYFLPEAVEGDAPSRPTAASFDAQGYYEAKAFADDRGLLPGRYRVSVKCWKTPPEMQGPPPVSYIPERYGSAATSGLELTIKPGDGSIEWDVPLKSQ